MNKRQFELLMHYEKVELKNLKLMLCLKQSFETLSQEETDFYLDKIAACLKRIEELEKLLTQ